MSDEPAWHAIRIDEVRERLRSSGAGISSEEAQARLATYGRNQLPEEPPPSLLQIFLRQFKDPLIFVLVIAAGVSVATGDVKDAGFIGIVLLINAVIGTWQERKAEESSRALKKLLQIRASVLRDGEFQEIPAEEVVPGDVVRFESGNRVPADVRLSQSKGIEIDESLLTGESIAVAKDPHWVGTDDVSLGDRINMAFAGSVVTRGRATGVVVGTGLATQVGRLASDVMGADAGKPPLLERMERFSKFIAVATLAVSVVIGGLGMMLGRYTLKETFLFVVALAVSAIPEGLPVAMTVALAIATNRMAKRQMIVRKLTAVEGLGSATLIATDKTGTLTANELTVREIRLPSGEQFAVTGTGFVPEGEVTRSEGALDEHHLRRVRELAEAGVLCNEADLHQRDGEWVFLGDAVDIAFLALGHKVGLTREELTKAVPEIAAIPFESERQFAATFHADGAGSRIFVKGAPEKVLDVCDIELTARADVDAESVAMARAGYRVLALASGTVEGEIDQGDPPIPSRLRFLGLVGMIDPVRPGVKEAIRACRDAGVSVAMVTGDHRVTALAIGRELGLVDGEEDGQVVTGPELEAMSPQDRATVAARTRVFARVAPRQKLEIVQAARDAGEFVVVTGDGANDAPALKTANIGVAMGKSGTDVAREAADLVLADDNFATIVAGVEEGRVAYDNIRKVAFLLVSCGAAELAMVLFTVLAGYPLPLLPVQLLWLNLVTNGLQGVALAFEPGEGDVLRRKPRPPSELIFNQLMLERIGVSVVTMGMIGFGTFAWLIQQGAGEAEARNILLLLMVLFENFHIGNCRSETKSAFRRSPLRSPFLLAGAIGAFLLHLAAMYLPFMQDVLVVGPLSLQQWVIVVALAVLIVPVMEVHKLTWRMRHGDSHR